MKHWKTVFFCGVVFYFFKLTANAQTTRVAVNHFAKIVSDSSVQKLDVRTGIEYDFVGYIADFIQINGAGKNFEKIVLQKLDLSKPVAVYCMSGHRSVDACKRLEKIGFKTIYELDGGIIQWVASGRKLE